MQLFLLMQARSGLVAGRIQPVRCEPGRGTTDGHEVGLVQVTSGRAMGNMQGYPRGVDQAAALLATLITLFSSLAMLC